MLNKGNPGWHFALASLLALCWSALTMLDSVHAASSWRPSGSVEIVVPTGPGGGVDSVARTLQKIIQDNHLMDVSTIVVNKPGGGGAIGYAYLNLQAGDGQTLAIAPISILTNQITGLSTIHYTDVTPVSTIGSEYVAIAVRNDSSFTSLRYLIEQLKKEPQSLVTAVSSRGGSNHIALALAMRSAGVDIRKMRVSVFKSGGESATALLGGHVDLIPASPSVLAPQLKAGKMRALAVTSPRRLGGAYSDVPTLIEQGIDVEYSNWRVVLGPKAMNQDQVAYWEGVISKVIKTDAWQKFLDLSLVQNTYMNSKDTRAYMDVQYAELTGILKELGMVK